MMSSCALNSSTSTRAPCTRSARSFTRTPTGVLSAPSTVGMIRRLTTTPLASHVSTSLAPYTESTDSSSPCTACISANTSSAVACTAISGDTRCSSSATLSSSMTTPAPESKASAAASPAWRRSDALEYRRLTALSGIQLTPNQCCGKAGGSAIAGSLDTKANGPPPPPAPPTAAAAADLSATVPSDSLFHKATTVAGMIPRSSSKAKHSSDGCAVSGSVSLCRWARTSR
mmetsp:Transcript_8219/g.12926  ORF Transcript_8219/g.12926 Transcript_8219/m.12926 type:complete len:230 (-) Transcript_8219:421-1110(-)